LNKDALEHRNGPIKIAAVIGDMICILVPAFIASSLRDVTLETAYLSLFFPAALCYYVAAESFGAYQSLLPEDRGVTTAAAITAWLFAAFGVMFGLFLLQISLIYSRFVILAWILGSGTLILSWRTVLLSPLLSLISSRFLPRRTVGILVSSGVCLELNRTLSDDKSLGLDVVGIYGDDESLKDAPGYRGGTELFQRAGQQKQFDIGIIPIEMADRIDFAEFVSTGTELQIVPPMRAQHLMANRIMKYGQISTINAYVPRLSYGQLALKRTLDIIVALTGLAVFCVPMLVIALSIKVSSRGPVLYRQQRIGAHGKPFVMWKFRTMEACEDGTSIAQATRFDDRVTSLGRFLRRTSLDELPQFANVLGGSMSVVGPRPHALAHNDLYQDKVNRYLLRHKLKPGITGLAQVSGARGETETLDKMQRRIDYDLYYIENWSLWMDIKILVKTLRVAFTDPNAY